ncbi:MAG: hypothetical protein N3A02_04450, partial [Rectinema sp.]|nr:hypothetical protein [Rectinema sp.]
MKKKSNRVLESLFCLTLICNVAVAPSQVKNPSQAPPRIDVSTYKLEVNLMPDTHELKASATITYK